MSLLYFLTDRDKPVPGDPPRAEAFPRQYIPAYQSVQTPLATSTSSTANVVYRSRSGLVGKILAINGKMQ